MLVFDHFKSVIKTELYLRYFESKCNMSFHSLININLYSIVSLIVSANQIAMCICINIAVLIYHDVIIMTLPDRSMWLDTHTGLKKAAF